MQEARDVNCLEGGGCFVCAETGVKVCGYKESQTKERQDWREGDVLKRLSGAKKFDIKSINVVSSRTEIHEMGRVRPLLETRT